MATHSGEAAVDWKINAIFIIIIMQLALQCTQCIVRLTANVLRFSESVPVSGIHTTIHAVNVALSLCKCFGQRTAVSRL